MRKETRGERRAGKAEVISGKVLKCVNNSVKRHRYRARVMEGYEKLPCHRKKNLRTSGS